MPEPLPVAMATPPPGGGGEPAPRSPTRLSRAVTVYGLSSGLSRGAPLLYLPLLTTTLTLGDFGLYSLAQVVLYLLVPLLLLNGNAAVEREGSVDADAGRALARDFTLLLVCTGGVAALLAVGLDRTPSRWPTLAIVLAALEGAHLLLLTFWRSRDRAGLYAAFSFVKMAGVLGVILAARTGEWSLGGLLAGQAALYAVLALPLLGLHGGAPSARSTPRLRTVLVYTLPLIPHGMAQWVMSGADRFIVKGFLGEAPLGVYSIGYTAASVLLVVNSGIALGLPPHFFRFYDRWVEGSTRRRFLTAYTAAAVAALVGVLLAVEADRLWTGWLGYGGAELPLTTAWVWAGLYLLGVYLFYTNYLFYHRRTGELAWLTALCALLNVVLTVVLVRAMGVVGAAVATCAAYACYLALVRRLASRVEPALRGGIVTEAAALAGVAAAMVAMGHLLAMRWA